MTMGTPFVSRLEPSSLEGFKRGKPHDEQPPTVPEVFLHAMDVREKVFVEEQHVPLENELDADDPRSCHWVVYAIVDGSAEKEVRHHAGNVTQPRKSSTRSKPVGTIRAVPFPHEPHPKPGTEYWNGQLMSTGKETAHSLSTNSTLDRGLDRATTFHNGKEPYIKLGRLAVVKEYRGHGFSKLLVQTALTWLQSHPTFFKLGSAEVAQTGGPTKTKVSKWDGLVCVHAQKEAIGLWEKWGFWIDEEMGSWWEEGIPHVGMFKRVEHETDRPPGVSTTSIVTD
ncbi:hypothetical protein E4U17_004872 [Claviceps sp. LM77 group G4]|nr:hypothetical protein E4U17_004872 [Claviceps sp. LM77 group G4]KAG6073122.1 hypothetical protein E4U33_003026 [Claviceps sp. LM78 group G4]